MNKKRTEEEWQVELYRKNNKIKSLEHEVYMLEQKIREKEQQVQTMLRDRESISELLKNVNKLIEFKIGERQ